MTTLNEIVETRSLTIVETNSINNFSICNTAFQNFHKICRFCLGIDNLKPFFNMTYNLVSVQSIIFDCLSLKVNPDDYLPFNLCEGCIKELIRCYKFRNRCIETTKVLHDVYDNRNFRKSEETTIQLNNSQCYESNTESLIIKEEETRNEYVLEDNLIIKNEDIKCVPIVYHAQTYEEAGSINLIQNDEIKVVPIVRNDKIVEDTNSDNLIIKNEIPEVTSIYISNDNDSTIDYETENITLKCGTIIHTKQEPYAQQSTQTSLSEAEFSSHMKKPLVCSVCKRSFSKQFHMDRHMFTHTGERPYKCTVCEKSFNQKCNLDVHMLIHTSKEPRKCSVCTKSFITKANLQRHMLSHTGKKLHKCEVCNKSFLHKSQLKIHILIHNGKRLHKCSICTKSFILKCNLKTHMLIHTGERRYKCGVCEKSFLRNSQLNEHMLIHSGERRHICHVCEKSFVRKSHLTSHSLTHMDKVVE